MTFRTVVRDGMINVNTYGALPDGTVVEVLLVAQASNGRHSKGRSPARRSATKPKSSVGGKGGKGGKSADYGAGSWAGRRDTKDPVAFLKTARRKTFKKA